MEFQNTGNQIIMFAVLKLTGLEEIIRNLPRLEFFLITIKSFKC